MASSGAGQTGETSPVSVADEVARALNALDAEEVRRTYWDQNEFIYLARWLPARLIERMLEEVERVRPAIHRTDIPRHKKGGSVTRATTWASTSTRRTTAASAARC